MEKRLISQCPVCSSSLQVSKLVCTCGTSIETQIPIPSFFRLPADLQQFVLTFLRCRGNIKEAEKALGISYPTVCKKLDQVNLILNNISDSQTQRMEILNSLERGEITAGQAAKLLRGEDTP